MNAKNLFIDATEGCVVQAAEMHYDNKHWEDINRHLYDCAYCSLAKGYSAEEWQQFLAYLDFEFKRDEYGCGLNGKMWFADGSWKECVHGTWLAACYSPRAPVETRLEHAFVRHKTETAQHTPSAN